VGGREQKKKISETHSRLQESPPSPGAFGKRCRNVKLRYDPKKKGEGKGISRKPQPGKNRRSKSSGKKKNLASRRRLAVMPQQAELKAKIKKAS